MKNKLMFLILIFIGMLLIVSSIPIQSHAERYESVTTTATTVSADWTLLQGSTARFSSFRIYERTGTKNIQVFGGGNTFNATAYFITVPPNVPYETRVYKSTVGVYVRVTGTGDTADVEFESKRPASYWPWR